MADAKEKQWAWEERQLHELSFVGSVYSREKFMKDAAEIVQEEERVQINENVSNKLAGKLEHEAFLGHGKKLRKVLEEEVRRLAEQKTKLSNTLDAKRCGTGNSLGRVVDLFWDRNRNDLFMQPNSFFRSANISFSRIATL